MTGPISQDPSISNQMYIGQDVAAQEAQGTAGVNKAQSPVVQDQIAKAEAGVGPAHTGASDSAHPSLPAPGSSAPPLPETSGNPWLETTNMVAFLSVMSDVLKEKLKDTAIEGQLNVKNQEATIAIGFAKADEIFAKGMSQAIQHAISGAVNAVGAAGTAYSAGQQAKGLKETVELNSGTSKDPAQSLANNPTAQKAYTDNKDLIAQKEAKLAGSDKADADIASGAPPTTQKLTAQEKADTKAEIAELQGKNQQLVGSNQSQQQKVIDLKADVVRTQVQVINEGVRSIDSFNQAAMGMVSTMHETEIAQMETEQESMRKGGESASSTKAKLEDDISGIINSMQEMVRKTNEAFSFRAA